MVWVGVVQAGFGRQVGMIPTGLCAVGCAYPKEYLLLAWMWSAALIAFCTTLWPMRRTSIQVSLVLAVSLLAMSSVFAQAKRATLSQAELQAKYSEKIHESWFAGGGWVDDYDLARKQAAAEKKFILAYFTRTYAP